MSTKPYPVVEARRQLPRLIDLAAAGKGPIYLGRRGRAEVALVSVADSRAQLVRRSLLGLAKLGSPAELSRSNDAMLESIEASLEGTEAMVLGGLKAPKAPRASKRTQSKSRG